MATLPDELVKAAPLGSWLNPLKINREPSALSYPDEFADRPSIYVVPPNGVITKWYRSYSDYCD